MTPLTSLTGTAAPLLEENVDTDAIFPARFLLITARNGLGRYAFHDRRFAADGTELADFVLNRAPWRKTQLLVAGANFGSGSSREQAVWALLGFGIRCVIAPSFGEIFRANCLRNGVLPLTLNPALVAELGKVAAAGQTFAFDLAAQTLVVGERTVTFAIPEEQRQALLSGWDETAAILNTRNAEISAFENRHAATQPWLFEQEPT